MVDDVIEVTGHDGDDNTVSDSDDATVTVNDVDPWSRWTRSPAPRASPNRARMWSTP
ncbi:MAG: hypothetical protein R2789_14390 [Microthrixaceae bacterium]